MTTDLGSEINDKIIEFVSTELKPLVGGEPYLAEAMMKMVIRDICHEMLVLGASANDVAEHLDVMADVMREKAQEPA